MKISTRFSRLLTLGSLLTLPLGCHEGDDLGSDIELNHLVARSLVAETPTDVVLEVGTQGCSPHAVNAAVGQSFQVPTRTKLRSLDIWLKAQLYYDTSYEIELYEGEGLSGQLLATSDPVGLAPIDEGEPTGWREFSYGEALMLEPAKTYTLRLRRLSQYSGAYSNCGDVYPDGIVYLSDQPYSPADMSFRVNGANCNPASVLRGDVPACDDLLLWLDAADADTVRNQAGTPAESGEEVVRWLDRGPHQNDAQNYAAAKRPTFDEGPAGLPAAHFDGDFMEIRSLDLRPSAAPQLTSFTVLRPTGGYSNVWVAMQNGFGKRTHVPTGSTLNTPIVSSMILEQDTNGTARRRHWLNGTQNADDQTSFDEAQAGVGLGALLYAWNGYAGAYPTNYELAQIAIFRGGLTSTERAEVEEFLEKQRWGDCYEEEPWTCVKVGPNEVYGSRTFKVPAAQRWINTGLYLRWTRPLRIRPAPKGAPPVPLADSALRL